MKTLQRIKQSHKFYESDFTAIPGNIESEIKNSAWLETDKTVFVDNSVIAELEAKHNLRTIYFK